MKLRRLSFLLGCQSCQSAQHLSGGVCGHPVGWLEPQCLCMRPWHTALGRPPSPPRLAESPRTESTGPGGKGPRDPTLRCSWQGHRSLRSPGKGGRGPGTSRPGGQGRAEAGASPEPPAEAPGTACWTRSAPLPRQLQPRVRQPVYEVVLPPAPAATRGRAAEGSVLCAVMTFRFLVGSSAARSRGPSAPSYSRAGPSSRNSCRAERGLPEAG